MVLEEKLPRVDIVVCHHVGNLVLKAIHSILGSIGVQIRLFVVTSDVKAKFYMASTLYAQGGPAYKRNFALRFTEADLIAFFDDDVEIDPYCIAEMAKVLQQDGVGMVFGKTLNMEFRDQFDEAGSYLTLPTGFLYARGDRTKDIGQFEKVEPILAGKSASCMIRRNVFAEVGFFDESYEILGEETDLAWRVWLYGWKAMYVPKSVAYHAFNTRFKPRDFYIPRRVYFNGCRNYITMLLTNLEDFNLPMPITCQLVIWFSASLGMFLTGKYQAGAYILKGLWYVFAHRKEIMEKRRKVQKARKLSDKELFPHILRTPPLSYYLKRFVRYVLTGMHG